MPKSDIIIILFSMQLEFSEHTREDHAHEPTNSTSYAMEHAEVSG